MYKFDRRVFANRFSCGTVELTVYDVYYDENGLAISRSTNPSSVFSGDGSLTCLRLELKQIEDALDKPIIDVNNFPVEFVF